MSEAGRLRPYMRGAEPAAGPLPPVPPGPFHGHIVDGEIVSDAPAEVDDEPTDASYLRPYQLTGGRTVPVDPTLAIEAQVVAVGDAALMPQMVRFEHRDVVSAARAPVSVAELGAQMYNIIGRMNGKPAAIIAIYQLPGSNAIQTMDAATNRSPPSTISLGRGDEPPDTDPSRAGRSCWRRAPRELATTVFP